MIEVTRIDTRSELRDVTRRLDTTLDAALKRAEAYVARTGGRFMMFVEGASDGAYVFKHANGTIIVDYIEPQLGAFTRLYESA